MEPAINLSSVANNESQTGQVGCLMPIDNDLRSAWQWLAMVTMLLDHLGFLYSDLLAFRYIGRLAMPLYAMLFIMSIQSGRVSHKRVLILALISQIPYLLLFGELKFNIIFCFYIFYWMTVAVKRRSWLGMVAVFAAMWIPSSYGWYLYASLAAFYWLDHKPGAKRSVFAIFTVIDTCLTNTHPRQLLAIVAPFLQGIKAPRPPKYLYRYFYPGHLFVLLIIDFLIFGSVITPFGTFPKPADDDVQWYNEYYDEYEPVEMYEINTGNTD
ncbi:MAG: hypothetical protein FVQ82_05435 [Planctomycetes bacterium]|nr:hypothetical protein [Planctomycetota bacterium]